MERLARQSGRRVSTHYITGGRVFPFSQTRSSFDSSVQKIIRKEQPKRERAVHLPGGMWNTFSRQIFNRFPAAERLYHHASFPTEEPEKCRNGLVFGNIKDGTREKQSIFLSLEVLEESVVTSEEIVKKVGDPLVSKEQMLQRSVSVDRSSDGDVLSTGGGHSFHEGGLLSLERPPEQFECKVPKSYSFDSRATLGETVSPDSVSFVRDASASMSSVAGGDTHPGLGSFVPHITLKKPKKLTTFSAIPYDRSKTNSQYRKVGPILTTEREVIDQSTSSPAGDGDGAQEEKSEGMWIYPNEILSEWYKSKLFHPPPPPPFISVEFLSSDMEFTLCHSSIQNFTGCKLIYCTFEKN
ncbi:hypothetical protein BSL78_12551 [Apostichopus japonicus]|uniref:Uncharacterized protein n=1 Tax=Stichopus japonicus TaxID=307972 RepID=A0A2G8KRE9_STIJA|nr:hypothetical protein BSL78_12551 [Apostichopus japonicus]